MGLVKLYDAGANIGNNLACVGRGLRVIRDMVAPMTPKCGICGRTVLVGTDFVGMPIIRITGQGKSQLTGAEVMFHVSCFLQKMQTSKPVSILQPNGKEVS